MNKINVLIVVDKFDYHGSYINGPTRYYSWLLERLDKDRFNAQLCALRKKGKSDDIFKRLNIEVSYLNLSKFNPLTFINIANTISSKEIDILHLTGYGATTFGRIAAAICGKPSIVHEHWVDPNIGKVYGTIERFLSIFTTKAIAISQYAKDFLMDKKGIRSDKIVIIPNGVPLYEFRNVDERMNKIKRKELGFSDEDMIIGMVGMLHENKGHKYFIQAASLVTAIKPNTRFVIIGDGELKDQLKRQVLQLGLESYVTFLGHRNDMPELLKVLDIFVMASISEAAGLSLLEAMASKKAIITTDSGGPSEIIRDGISGLIVPVKNAKAIADKILYLIANPSLTEFLSENAYKESEKYDFSFTARQIEELYEEVFAQSKMARIQESLS